MNTAQLHQRFLLTSGISTDSRNIKPNTIFFGLKGENFNGSKYALEALKKGAKIAVAAKYEGIEAQPNVILVDDPLKSLQDLAKYHREYLDLKIIAITGSNGKTTTKELIYAVLSKKYDVVATQGNLNNHIGVPLTLLSMDSKNEIGVVEMGASAIGEIRHLCDIAKPNYGLITNFGKAHLEGFGSIEGVIKGKSELYNFLKKKHELLFINLDDKIQREEKVYAHHFSFGQHPEANVQLNYNLTAAKAEVRYNDTNFKSKITGAYNASNMAAAICIGLYFKVKFEDIKEAIAQYEPKNNRSQVIEKAGNTIFLDAYNANPSSMQASLKNFQNLQTSKPKIAILGDMLELGATSETEHQLIINQIENSNFSETYLVGPKFGATESEDPSILKFDTIEGVKEHLRKTEPKETHFLLKGSRALALERILEAL